MSRAFLNTHMLLKFIPYVSFYQVKFWEINTMEILFSVSRRRFRNDKHADVRWRPELQCGTLLKHPK